MWITIQWNPFWEATLMRGHPSGKATWQCKSKHKGIDIYPWREATPLERPLLLCKRGGLIRGVPLYIYSILIGLNWCTTVFNNLLIKQIEIFYLLTLCWLSYSIFLAYEGISNVESIQHTWEFDRGIVRTSGLCRCTGSVRKVWR